MCSDPNCGEEFMKFISYEFPYSKNEFNEIHISTVAKTETMVKVKLKNPCIKTTRLSNGKYKKLAPKIFPVEIKVLENQDRCTDSMNISWNFQDWLMYVTESINQTMHFNNYGNLNTLLFCIPQVFNFFLFKYILLNYNFF